MQKSAFCKVEFANTPLKEDNFFLKRGKKNNHGGIWRASVKIILNP